MRRHPRELRQAADDPLHPGQEGRQPFPPGPVHEEPRHAEGGDQGRVQGGHPQGVGQPQDHEAGRDGSRQDASGPGQ